jgi:hypothetical protein
MEDNPISPVVADATNEVIKDNPSAAVSPEQLIIEVGKKFIEKQLAMFPYYCVEARRLNVQNKQFLNEIGNPGGWSESRDFKYDYEIPKDLYLFMQNLVYKEFWAEHNEKVWRSFMKGIMRGDDVMELLMKVKMYYGSNQSLQTTGDI